jgi:YgiT-type zinc finger domain-containing protein
MATLAEKLEGLQCPRCGHEHTYVVRDVEHTEKVGHDTVTVTITVGVCTNCGEQALDSVAARKIEDAVKKLKAGAVSDLVHMGEAYQYP